MPDPDLDPVPDPTQMGLAQEALDLLKKAGASVEEIAQCISSTGKEAGSYLTSLVNKLKGYFAKQPMATTAPAKSAPAPSHGHGPKKGVLIFLALLSCAGTAEACHRGKRGQAQQQQPSVTYYYQQAAPAACAGPACATPPSTTAPQVSPVLYLQEATGGCASGSCAPGGRFFHRR